MNLQFFNASWKQNVLCGKLHLAILKLIKIKYALFKSNDCLKFLNCTIFDNGHVFFFKLEAIAQSYKTIKDRRKNKVIGNFIV